MGSFAWANVRKSADLRHIDCEANGRIHFGFRSAEFWHTTPVIVSLIVDVLSVSQILSGRREAGRIGTDSFRDGFEHGTIEAVTLESVFSHHTPYLSFR